MPRKIVTVITLAAFVLFSISCTIARTMETTKFNHPGRRAKIVNLIKESGERVVFSGCGRMEGDTITGMADAGIEKHIPTPFSAIKEGADGSVFEIIDRNGQAHQVLAVLQKGETGWTILARGGMIRQVSIPLSEVRQVTYTKINTGLTILALAPLAALGLILLGVYIYSNNI